jgi:hypothetical protein
MKITMDGNYQTRDGRKVRVLAVDLKNPTYPVAAAVSDGKVEIAGVYTENGRWLNTTQDSRDDLIPIPKPFSIEAWSNVFNDGSCNFHKTREAADRNYYGRVACVRVVITGNEGDGL